jgi:hypothetical protein
MCLGAGPCKLWVGGCLKGPLPGPPNGVAELVGGNERWKLKPWAQWEPNQDQSFLWIRPRPLGWAGEAFVFPA